MKTNEYRIEKDSMGEVKVPKEALYAAQTQRAIDNFILSNLQMPRAFIRSLGLIKYSAAKSNGELGLLEEDMVRSICQAAELVANGKYDDQFPIDVFQTGSGTSSNMNANEVIANLATGILGRSVHPNDHVNMGQSSNDVVPTAIHVGAALVLVEQLIPAMKHLAEIIQDKVRGQGNIVKTGRTHLMDAMPVTFGQELGGWKSQVMLGIDRLNDTFKRIRQLPQGGTAVGTGINAHPRFKEIFINVISEHTGINFSSKDNLFEGLSAQDASVELSGQLKTISVGLLKICNDLRWMNSGPFSGLGEITLPALQPGSSIMPGKVNPVIPESVAMVCVQVIGNDAAITVAGQSGNFQLNVMLPVIAYNLDQSLNLLANACVALADSAIKDFKINELHLKKRIEKNPVLITALNPIIGYDQGAMIAKEALKRDTSIRDVVLEMTDLESDVVDSFLDPRKLVNGGILE